MKHFLLILFFVRISICAVAQTTDPDKSRLIFDDVQRFWETYNLTFPKLSPEQLTEGYINQLSAPLKKTYLPLIVGGNADSLASRINENLAYFNQLRSLPLDTQSMVRKIRKSYRKLKELYSFAQYPEVYFAFGNFASAGANMNGTLAISLEMFSKKPTKINEVLTLDYKLLSAVVLHEVIHFQQKYKPDASLLALSIKEGAADFLTQLISKENTIQTTIKHASNNEEAIWHEFKSVMYTSNLHNWLYTHDPNHIKDLGYFIGFKITQSYYNASKDKKSAVNEILNIQDYTKFLEDSGYERKFLDN